IVADQSAVNSMTIDGVPMNPAEFQPIPNTRFAYAQHSLEQGTHNISGAKPFGVTVYALGPVDSYAYTGGTGLKTITPLKTVALSIDFGDRVLAAADITPPYQYSNSDHFDTTVVLQNVSTDTVNVYSFPRRIGDTDRFYVAQTSNGNTITPTPTGPSFGGPGIPLTIAPLATDSFTIEFWPHEVNRRMHTQITAKTDHLRAYVVDVYGRGVMDEMGVFRDTNKIYTIDTLFFGTFDKSDLAADSEVYVGNAGTAGLDVSNVQITGDPTDFSMTGILYNGSPVTPTFSIPEPPSGAAKIGLRFTPNPGMANGYYTAQLTITSKSSTHVVVLLARIETITALAPAVAAISWGSTLVCDDSVFNITIPNNNDLPVTVTGASIAGANAADFAVSSPTPLVIPAHGSAAVQVLFSPVDTGIRSASAVLTFDLPKNAKPDTVALAGSGNKLTFELAIPTNIHAYILDNSFLVPIYAKDSLNADGADGYQIILHYDATHLKLVDIVMTNTLTPPGYPELYSSVPGNDTIIFQQGGEGKLSGNTPITGGGDSSLPLIWLKFQPVAGDVDPNTFQAGYPIHFTTAFSDATIPYPCANHLFDSGYVAIDPACGTQYLEPQPAIPSAMMLGNPTPNPAGTLEGQGSPIQIAYDISESGNAQIVLVGQQGNIVQTIAEGFTQPGYYTARIDASALPSGTYLVQMKAGNYVRAKKIVIQK